MAWEALSCVWLAISLCSSCISSFNTAPTLELSITTWGRGRRMVLLILSLKIVKNKLKLWEIEDREMDLLILGWKIVENKQKLWEIEDREMVLLILSLKTFELSIITWGGREKRRMILLILGLKIVENKQKLWEIGDRELVLLILGWKTSELSITWEGRKKEGWFCWFWAWKLSKINWNYEK